MDLNKITTSVTMQVPFHDIDSMNVMWHGNYFRYFEIAREKLLDTFGYGYTAMRESGYVWPIIDTRVQYRGAVLFEQKIIVIATLAEYENRLKIKYEILDATTKKKLTTGYTIQSPVLAGTQELLFACPQILLDRVQTYYATL